MKKVILTLAIIASMVTATNATQWSISNSALNPGQFNNVTTAMASGMVLNGDTFLIHPTATSYGDITTTKSLVFISEGFNTQKSPVNYATFNNVNLGAPATVSGTKFYGIRFAGVYCYGTGTLNNVTFENCYFANQLYITGLSVIPVNMVVKNCIFPNASVFNIELGQSYGGQVSSSIYVTNCLFGKTIDNNKGSLIVRNCTFTQGGFNNVEYATFENCIFRTLAVSGVNLSTFTNCISGVSVLPTAGNGGINNLAPAAVLFVNVPVNNINLTYDYHLTPASPGYTGGNDGQQLGIFGGSSTFSITGESLNSAIIRTFNITNSVVPVNGTLNINATVTKPNNQ